MEEREQGGQHLPTFPYSSHKASAVLAPPTGAGQSWLPNGCLGDAHTYAEKLMLNSYRKGMPYKSSYLYCDALDTCFFFDHDGHACVSVSASWRNGAKDLGRPIREALTHIQNMLNAMTEEADQWLRGGRDERA